MTFFEKDDSRVKAKICGITTPEQAHAIVEMGADALGFNFYPKSKRFLTRNTDVDSWLQELAGKTTRIGVFVNPTREEIADHFEKNVIDFAQLHGDESPEFVAELSQAGFPSFKALGVRDATALDHAATFSGAENAVLLDAYAPVEYGGTGETMDWKLGREAVEAWPERKIILAGGLVAENVADAIAQVQPFAVDVASGVESGEPGMKDLEKVRAFLAAAQEVKLRRTEISGAKKMDGGCSMAFTIAFILTGLLWPLSHLLSNSHEPGIFAIPFILGIPAFLGAHLLACFGPSKNSGESLSIRVLWRSIGIALLIFLAAGVIDFLQSK